MVNQELIPICRKQWQIWLTTNTLEYLKLELVEALAGVSDFISKFLQEVILICLLIIGAGVELVNNQIPGIFHLGTNGGSGGGK